VAVALLCSAFFREFLALLPILGARAASRVNYYYMSLVGLMSLLALSSVHSDYFLYFKRQATDPASWREFHTMEAMVGKRLADLPGKEKVFLAPPYFRHPSILFLARDFQEQNRFDILNLSNVLPRRPCPDGAVFILEDIHKQLASVFDYFYDSYDFEEVKDPWGRTIFTLYRVSGDELARARSLRLRGWQGKAGQGPAQFERRLKESSVSRLDLPANTGRLRLSGSFYLGRSGLVGFRLTGGSGKLVVDGRQVVGLNGMTGRRELEKGYHSLRLDAEPDGARLDLLWLPPGLSGWSRLTERNLCAREQVHGLRAAYYNNVAWQGAAALEQIDPLILFRWHIDPLPEKFSTIWRGGLLVPESGEYLIKTRSNDHCWVKLDGEEVLKFDQGVEGAATRRLWLAKGQHPIEVKYIEFGGLSFMELWWQVPGSQEAQIIPMNYLVP
jgi:hypothetical protein